jgi:ferredoxin
VCADDAQYAFALTWAERGFHTHISTAFDVPLPDSSCVFCGQCIGVCPTGALKPKIEWGLEHGWNLEDIWKSTRPAPQGCVRQRLECLEGLIWVANGLHERALFLYLDGNDDNVELAEGGVIRSPRQYRQRPDS